MSSRRHYAITLEQAAQSSPALSQLVRQAQDAKARMKAIEPLLPPGLRNSVQAGPMTEKTWCLLIKNNAAASKVQYLLPSLAAHLRTKGWDVQHIELKVLSKLPWQSPL